MGRAVSIGEKPRNGKSSSGVSGLICLTKSVGRNVRIDLCGRQVSVPQQFLNAAQIGAASAGSAETTIASVGGGIFRVSLWVPGRQDAIDTPFTVAAF